MLSIALCIPAYNAAKFLPKIIASAKDQEIPFSEILVYDDASTDDTKEVAIQLGATVINGKINSGCSYGKNKLAEATNCDWIHFHDADDVLLPNFTTVAAKWIDQKISPDIVLLNYEWIDFDTKRFLGKADYNINDLLNDPIAFNINNKVVNFALIKRKSFLKIGGFDTDPKVLYNEDRAFYTRAALAGLTFSYEPELTCTNFFYKGSMSEGNKAKCAKASLEVWKKVINGTNGKYDADIAAQILKNATFAATANDWQTVRNSIALVKNMDVAVEPSGSRFFKFFYKIHPFISFYLREITIRYFTNKRR